MKKPHYFLEYLSKSGIFARMGFGTIKSAKGWGDTLLKHGVEGYWIRNKSGEVLKEKLSTRDVRRKYKVRKNFKKYGKRRKPSRKTHKGGRR